MRKVLVAGVGNIFLGDDGFGVEVATRLAEEPVPEGVHVEDYGIRAVHLAYELLEGYDGLVLVDAMARGENPGTVYVFEPDLAAAAADESTMDAHTMSPDTVLALLLSLGGQLEQVYVVGCEPAELSARMGLSPAVVAGVDDAMGAVRGLVSAMIDQPWPGPVVSIPSPSPSASSETGPATAPTLPRPAEDAPANFTDRNG
jgi:hydrogenase maturation protease